MRKHVELEDTKDDSEDDDNRTIKIEKQATSPMEQKSNNEPAVKNGPAGTDKEEQMAEQEID